jgi:phosphoglycerate-specific signal transduction histidine kinase
LGFFSEKDSSRDRKVEDLQMNRMIKELDRLSLTNEALAATVETQRKEIDKIREQLMEHGQKVVELTTANQEMAAKCQALEKENQRLRNQNPPIM